MQMKELLIMMKNSFFVITAGITLSAGVFCSVFYRDAVFGAEIFWQILLLALLTTLPFFVYYSKKELRKRAWLVRNVIQIIILMSILLFFGSLWEWISINNPLELLLYIALIAVVYILVYTVAWQKDRRVASELNKGLKKYKDSNKNS